MLRFPRNIKNKIKLNTMSIKKLSLSASNLSIKKQKLRSKKTKTNLFSFIFVFFTFLFAFFCFFRSALAANASCSVPAQIIDLTNWKETLPTGSSGKPTEITQTALKSFSKKPFFTPNSSCSGVIFRAPVNGITTKGSSYPRSELREMTNKGKSNASWATNVGTHSMYIDQAITSVPKTKKHLVAGQIHDASDDVIVIRLEYPKLFVDINGKTGPTLDAKYVLGKRFAVQFIASKGQIKVYYNGSKLPVYTLKKTRSGNYFKAGAYTQSNCKKEKVCNNTNFGEVVIYKLSVRHSSSNTANFLVTSSDNNKEEVLSSEIEQSSAETVATAGSEIATTENTDAEKINVSQTQFESEVESPSPSNKKDTTKLKTAYNISLGWIKSVMNFLSKMLA